MKKKNTGNKSSRKCVKDFFDRKIPELKQKVVQDFKNGDGKHYYSNQSLRKSIIIERQLDEMVIFGSSDSQDNSLLEILKKTPVTHLKCESQFSHLDNQFKVAGGSSTIETLSKKSIIRTNKLLTYPHFTDLTNEVKMGMLELG